MDQKDQELRKLEKELAQAMEQVCKPFLCTLVYTKSNVLFAIPGVICTTKVDREYFVPVSSGIWCILFHGK